MEKEIKLDDIEFFYNQYQNNPKNLEIEHGIRKYGILKSSIDQQKIDEFQFQFNIETPDTKIYDQLGSHQCNIYAFFRVIKDILRNSSELDVNSLDFSANYINFYDKFEKMNVLYNELISIDSLSLEIINQKVNHYIGSYGTFIFVGKL